MKLQQMVDVLDVKLGDTTNKVQLPVKVQVLNNAQDDIYDLLRMVDRSYGVVWADQGIDETKTLRLPANFLSFYDMRHYSGGYGSGDYGAGGYGAEPNVGDSIYLADSRHRDVSGDEAYMVGSYIVFQSRPSQGVRLYYHPIAWPMFLAKVQTQVSTTAFRLEPNAILGQLETEEDSYAHGVICVTDVSTGIAERRRVLTFDASTREIAIDAALSWSPDPGDTVELEPIVPGHLHRYIVRVAAAEILGDEDMLRKLRGDILSRARRNKQAGNRIQPTSWPEEDY